MGNDLSAFLADLLISLIISIMLCKITSVIGWLYTEIEGETNGELRSLSYNTI
jgi:hypothetical protein